MTRLIGLVGLILIVLASCITLGYAGMAPLCILVFILAAIFITLLVVAD